MFLLGDLWKKADYPERVLEYCYPEGRRAYYEKFLVAVSNVCNTHEIREELGFGEQEEDIEKLKRIGDAFQNLGFK